MKYEWTENNFWNCHVEFDKRGIGEEVFIVDGKEKTRFNKTGLPHLFHGILLSMKESGQKPLDQSLKLLKEL